MSHLGSPRCHQRSSNKYITGRLFAFSRPTLLLVDITKLVTAATLEVSEIGPIERVHTTVKDLRL